MVILSLISNSSELEYIVMRKQINEVMFIVAINKILWYEM